MSSFIVTQFPHGSGGKFLSTILQTSTKVAHWNSQVQEHKGADIINDLHIGYVKRTLLSEYRYHLMHEPMVPYNTSFYSTSFDRGNDVTLDEYIAYQANNTKFIDDYGKFLLNLIFSKTTLPKFCRNSKTVVILAETDAEQSWLHKTLWNKHFYETDSDIRYIPYDPDMCNMASLPMVLKFKNNYIYKKSQKDELYEKMVVNNQNAHNYRSRKNFNKNSYFITLHSLLNTNLFIKEIVQLFDTLELGKADIELIKQMHGLWVSHQVKFSD
jgi:hypothetical protein